MTSCDGTLTCLRTVDALTLNSAANAIESGNFFGVFTFVPVVDGSFIVERPISTLNKKKHNSVQPALSVSLCRR
jgi:carboxylesterase type B